jgi:hypothetical protein
MVAEPARHFEVKRTDLHQYRLTEEGVPVPRPGEVLLRVDAFGFTSNNITYAVFGEAMSYWVFFSAPGDWGRIPVWGYANVVSSTVDSVVEGTRVFGYLPMSTHLVVTPDRADERGFVDGATHRASLPSAYNRYEDARADSTSLPEHEAQRMILWPLFFTSFLLDGYLGEAEYWGADTIVMSSASSKTTLGTAFLLADRDDVELVGLTSAGNADFVDSLGTYDRVVAYDDVKSLPPEHAVYVDVAGNGQVRDAVHRHYGDDLLASVIVGGTHWDQPPVPGDLAGPAPSFFFAPDHIRTRTRQSGRGGFESDLGAAWTRFVGWTADWLTVIHDDGPEAVERVYLDQLDGRTDASTGHTLSMWS